jgi:hypothetical protein
LASAEPPKTCCISEFLGVLGRAEDVVYQLLERAQHAPELVDVAQFALDELGGEGVRL